jgi:excisionase family DNA binding protein
MPKDAELTLPEAAKHLGSSEKKVRRLIKTGKLPAAKPLRDGKYRYVITRSSLQSYQKSRHQTEKQKQLTPERIVSKLSATRTGWEAVENVAKRILEDLEAYARELGELGPDDVFPESRARELREKIVEGLSGYAVRRMGRGIEAHLEDGRQNFLDHFRLNHKTFDPGSRGPREYERFWEPFEKSRFFIPLKPGQRTIVHHNQWAAAWQVYRDVLPVLREIKRRTRGNVKLALRAINERLPGIPEDMAKKNDSYQKAFRRGKRICTMEAKARCIR